MYFTHSLAGAIAVKPIIEKVEKNFTEKEKVVLWFIGITASVLPDFDLLYMFLSKSESHRYFATHGIALYLIIFVVTYLLRFIQEKKEFGRRFFKVAPFIFLAGVLTHFVLDALVGGIAFFSPFSHRIIGFDMNIRKEGVNWLSEYLKSKYMYLEFLITSIFLYVFKEKKSIVPRIFSLFYFIVALVSFILISTLMS